MTIINKNTYCSIFFKKKNFILPDDISQYTQNKQRFSYGNVSYHKFSKKYSPNGWECKNLLALPSALWSGVAKTIYHLCILIFSGIPKACFGKLSTIKAAAFSIPRDLQESLGYLTSLFNETYGSYLIQKSEFHKDCYDNFTKKHTRQSQRDKLKTTKNNFREERVSSPPHQPAPIPRQVISSLPRRSAPVDDIFNYPTPKTPIVRSQLKLSVFYENTLQHCSDISLQRLCDATLEQRTVILRQTGQYRVLQALIHQLNVTEKDITAFVKLLPSSLLEILTLQDITEDLTQSSLPFALMSDEAFNALTLRGIQGVRENQFLFISKRMKLQTIELGELVRVSGNPLPDDINSLPLKDLCTLSSAEVAQNVQLLLPEAFLFFNDNQVRELELESLTDAQISCFFTQDNEKDLKARLALFSDRAIATIINDNKLGDIALTYLSDAQILLLDIGRLHREQIEMIFLNKSENDCRRFACYADHEVLAAIRHGSLTGDYLFKLLSDDQLRGLKLSELTKEQVEFLFPYSSISENIRRGKEKMALIDASEVHASIISRNINHSYQFSLLSTDQLKTLELSKLTKEQIEFLFSYSSISENIRRGKEKMALIDASEIHASIISRKIDQEYQFSLLSTDQLKTLELSKLTKGQIEFLFPYSSISGDIRRGKEKMALINASEVQASIILRKIDQEYQFSLLSTDQLKTLELSKLTKGQIEFLFPYSSISKNIRKCKEKMALINASEVHASIISRKINQGYQFSLLSTDQLKTLELSKLTKGQIEFLFPYSSISEDIRKCKEKMALFPRSEIELARTAGLFKSDYLERLCTQ